MMDHIFIVFSFYVPLSIFISIVANNDVNRYLIFWLGTISNTHKNFNASYSGDWLRWTLSFFSVYQKMLSIFRVEDFRISNIFYQPLVTMIPMINTHQCSWFERKWTRWTGYLCSTRRCRWCIWYRTGKFNKEERKKQDSIKWRTCSFIRDGPRNEGSESHHPHEHGWKKQMDDGIEDGRGI